MSAQFDFDVGSFTDVVASHAALVKKLWEWMWENDNVIRMETASDLNRVAVEPLQRFLLRDFDKEVIRQHRTKQMIGRMARQILEQRGFTWAGKDYKVPTGDLFTTGSKYRRKSN